MCQSSTYAQVAGRVGCTAIFCNAFISVKKLERSHDWRPGASRDILGAIHSCRASQLYVNNPRPITYLDDKFSGTHRVEVKNAVNEVGTKLFTPHNQPPYLCQVTAWPISRARQKLVACNQFKYMSNTRSHTLRRVISSFPRVTCIAASRSRLGGGGKKSSG